MTIAELSVGSTIAGGSYRLVEVIASGGFSITYRALDLRSGPPYSTVVIKEHAYAGACYRDTSTGDVRPLRGREPVHRKLIERVLREAALLMTVRHPHVVYVSAAWEERGTAYYAMESLSGQTLEGEIEQASDAAWDDFRSSRLRMLSLQLAGALRAIHDKSVYHCDVKPDNVLLTPRGAILIDFGAARTEAQLSRTVTLMPFTAGYAAPELQNPETIRRVGPWTDAYAWGMLVYGLVAGHPEMGYPLDALARLTRLQKHGANAVDPYEHAEQTLVDKGLSARWARAVHACLRIDPGDRPQSMQALEELLGEDASAVMGLPLPERTLRGFPAPIFAGAPNLSTEGSNLPTEASNLPTEGSNLSTGVLPPPDAAKAETPRFIGITEMTPPLFTGPGVAALLPRPQQPNRTAVRRRWKAPGLLLALCAIVSAGIAAAVRMRPADVPSSKVSAGEPPEAVLTAEPAPPSLPAAPIAACSEFQIRCGEFCAWATDPNFGCGSCKPCSLDHTRKAQCEKQRCAPKECEPGWGNCDGVPKNGCETHLENDVEHCGSCDNRCGGTARAPEPVCRGGQCETGRCEQGWDDCNGRFEDGCEANLQRDIAHCGSCSTSCGDVPHAVRAACRSGNCQIKRCEDGWQDCNGSFDDGCEANLDSDPAHCGDCNQSCGARRNAAVECRRGACELRCRASWADCDGNEDNGCETDTSSSPLHCGACGETCRGRHVVQAGCAGGACTIGACSPGWNDCDGNAGNGCECRDRPPELPPRTRSVWERWDPGAEDVLDDEPQ